jgi:hypothetical protein
MTFWTWKWKCNLNSLDWYIPTKNVIMFLQKWKKKKKKKNVKITHKQLKVECIQLTKFMTNIQKWNHYKNKCKVNNDNNTYVWFDEWPNIRLIWTNLLMWKPRRFAELEKNSLGQSYGGHQNSSSLQKLQWKRQ